MNEARAVDPPAESPTPNGQTSAVDLKQQFSALYERTYAKILSFAARRADTPENAADAVAETFLIAWRRIDQIPVGDAGLYWLYATARFVLANQGRAERRRSITVERIANELRWTFPGQTASIDDQRSSARVLLQRLAVDDREVLLLAGWECLDARAIAEVVGCTPTAARIRLHRARHRLSELLGDSQHRPNRSANETP